MDGLDEILVTVAINVTAGAVTSTVVIGLIVKTYRNCITIEVVLIIRSDL